MIEKLKAELNILIERYDLTNQRVLSKSQELDKLIVLEQRKSTCKLPLTSA